MKRSAGILLYKRNQNSLQFFLVHPGGPFWQNKDEGAWSIPKGEYSGGEDPLQAAIREFKEETGVELSASSFMNLGEVKLKSGKIILAWACEGDIDPSAIRSNSFKMEWPPRSGKFSDFPEVDKGAWFVYREALEKINPAQAKLLEQLNFLLSH